MTATTGTTDRTAHLLALMKKGDDAYPATGKAFDVEFGQTVKWDGDRVIRIAAFWDATAQAHQIGLRPARNPGGGSQRPGGRAMARLHTTSVVCAGRAPGARAADDALGDEAGGRRQGFGPVGQHYRAPQRLPGQL